MEKYVGWETNPPKSDTVYFHDQKGRWTDPMGLTVGLFRTEKEHHKYLEQQRKEYLEDQEDTTQELQDIRTTVDLLINKPTLVEIFIDLINHCQAYLESIIKLKRIKEINAGTDQSTYLLEVGAADDLRKRLHDAVIRDLTILVRNLVARYGPDGTEEPHEEEELPHYVQFLHDHPSREQIGYWACRFGEAAGKLPQEEINHIREAAQKK